MFGQPRVARVTSGDQHRGSCRVDLLHQAQEDDLLSSIIHSLGLAQLDQQLTRHYRLVMIKKHYYRMKVHLF